MFKYCMPDENNNPVQYYTENNSVIIIGANGSGKSKLGAWLEKQDIDNVHRISAQRSLNFGDFIQLKSFEEAERLLFYGTLISAQGKGPRWKWGNETITMLNDYEDVLSSLIAKASLQNNEFIKKCRENKKQGKNYPEIPTTVIDDLENIWNEVFPHRQISFDDSKVMTSFEICKNDDSQKIEYKGKEMSDGERVALYLIAQCLCIPKNKIIIIDEPELHLHRSIMNSLWCQIESKRNDCLFIYITHDTCFAASHTQSEKFWIKEYDGNTWKYEKVNESHLPEQMLLDILGNRKNVLFVEGTADSFDTKLYRHIYKDYYIVACGSCTSVINHTKAFKATTQLHDFKCYGIIDRDYRSEYEIQEYKKHNIYCVGVAEVENLFIVPEILAYVNNEMAIKDKLNIENIENYIVKDRYENEKKKQVLNAIIAQTKYKLSTVNLSTGDQTDKILNDISSYIAYEELKKEIEDKFNEIKDITCYEDCLKIYNQKKLCQSIGKYFGLKNEEYCEFILRKLETEDENEIVKCLEKYLPTEIPRL